MVKAQSRFGGTKPKETGVSSRVAKETTGTQKPAAPHIVRKTTVKQVGITKAPKANNSQMIRDKQFSTRHIKSISKPAGKEDNRTSWR